MKEEKYEKVYKLTERALQLIESQVKCCLIEWVVAVGSQRRKLIYQKVVEAIRRFRFD